MKRTWLVPLIALVVLIESVACAGPSVNAILTPVPGTLTATVSPSGAKTPTLVSQPLPTRFGGIDLPTPAPSGTVTGISTGLAPAMSAAHVGRSECLVCHASGSNGAPKLTTMNPDHSTFTDTNNAANCLGCHSIAK